MFIDHATPEDIVEWYENARDVDMWEAEAWHEPGEPVLRNLLESLEGADEAFTIHEDDSRVFMCLGYISDSVTAYPWTGAHNSSRCETYDGLSYSQAGKRTPAGHA